MTSTLLADHEVIERIFDHIDNGTTDEGDLLWQEPINHYHSLDRLNSELELMRRVPLLFCPSAALPEPGSYVARSAAGTPLVVVRGEDGVVRGFRNACRHRGMPVAEGNGCSKVFVCGYHGWAYRLDGRLQYIPHDRGFPQVDKPDFGLVPVTVDEAHGLVFVTQKDPVNRGALDGLDDLGDLIHPDQQLFESSDTTTGVNWKLNAEATLEGYHIKPTHPQTFYPYGYDNLTLVELFGRNSRVTFPFRRIEKLRDLPSDQRKIDGMVTYTYQLYPNVTVAVLSNHTSISIAEPISPTQTRFITYRLTNHAQAANAQSPEANREVMERAKRDAKFVAEEGLKEDQAVVKAIQSGLQSGANTHFTYGRFETGIAHFHKTLSEGLELIT